MTGTRMTDRFEPMPEGSFTIYAVTVNHDGTLTAWRCTITRIPPATPEQRLSAALNWQRTREAD